MAVRNYSVDRSTDLQIDINVSDTDGAVVDLTNYTANACFKKHHESNTNVAFSTLGYANGLLTVSLTGTETLNTDVGRYIYEVYITHNTANTTSLVQNGILSFQGSGC